MKFKTLRTSETGKKFESVEQRKNICFNKAKEIVEEVNADQWRGCAWTAFGGISALLFADGVQMPEYFKKDKFGCMPKMNTTKGKELHVRIKELPTVSILDLNMCIGYNERMKRTIGCDFSNKEYILFAIGDDWNIEIPSDCEEITVSEYKALSNVAV